MAAYGSLKATGKLLGRGLSLLALVYLGILWLWSLALVATSDLNMGKFKTQKACCIRVALEITTLNCTVEHE